MLSNMLTECVCHKPRHARSTTLPSSISVHTPTLPSSPPPSSPDVHSGLPLTILLVLAWLHEWQATTSHDDNEKDGKMVAAVEGDEYTSVISNCSWYLYLY